MGAENEEKEERKRVCEEDKPGHTSGPGCLAQHWHRHICCPKLGGQVACVCVFLYTQVRVCVSACVCLCACVNNRSGQMEQRWYRPVPCRGTHTYKPVEGTHTHTHNTHSHTDACTLIHPLKRYTDFTIACCGKQPNFS